MKLAGNEQGTNSPERADDPPDPNPLAKVDPAGDLEANDAEIVDLLQGAADIRPIFSAGITRVSIGPLPPADEYTKYELATPGAGEDIRNMAKSEQRNQHERRMRKLRNDFWHRIASLVVPAVVILAVIAVGGFLVYLGNSIEGLIGVLSPLAGVLGVFVYRNPRRAKNDNGTFGR